MIIETLISSFRKLCELFPDKRTGSNIRYGMGDIGMTAFSIFFMQSPSFLSSQRALETGRGQSNCQTLFGIDNIPSDNHVRDMLDPVAPARLFPLFGKALTTLEKHKGLAGFRRLDGRILLPLTARNISNHRKYAAIIARPENAIMVALNIIIPCFAPP